MKIDAGQRKDQTTYQIVEVKWSLYPDCGSYAPIAPACGGYAPCRGVWGDRTWGTAKAALLEKSGFSRKEGPPTYAILLRNLVLSRFTHFLKGFHRALNKSHPAFNF